MLLVDVAADDPHFVLVNDVPSGVPPFPISGGVEFLVAKRVRLDLRPSGSVGRTPHVVAADSGECFFVRRVPTSNEPHLPLEGESSGTISRRKGGFGRNLFPLIFWRLGPNEPAD